MGFELCNGLNVVGPRSGTIWRRGLVGVGGPLLEEKVSMDFKTFVLAARKPVFSYQPSVKM